MSLFTISWSEIVDCEYTVESSDADEAYQLFRDQYPYSSLIDQMVNAVLIENSIAMSEDGYEIELMDHVGS